MNALPKLDLSKFSSKYGYIKGFVVPLLIYSFFTGLGFLWGNNVPHMSISAFNDSFNNVSQPELVHNAEISAPRHVITQALGSEDSQKTFSEHTNEWVIQGYDGPDSDGYYCPNNWAAYPAPDIIYRTPIKAIFNSLYFRYTIKNIDSSIKTPQTFVFSLGEKNSRIFRIYIPQTNPQSVGFERFFTNNFVQSSKYDPGQSFPDPIAKDIPVELTVRSIPLSGSKVEYTFNTKYLTSEQQKPVENSVSYDIDLQDPDPSNLFVQFGMATYKGNCINPDQYNISE